MSFVMPCLYLLFIFSCRQHANSVGTLSGHGSWILSVDFCPDNTHFVSRYVITPKVTAAVAYLQSVPSHGIEDWGLIPGRTRPK